MEIEEDFLLEQIVLDKVIGKNRALKENLFLIFLFIATKIPLIIIDKQSGTGKRLAVQLIMNSMKGEYSKSKFFINYPSIHQIYYQGLLSTKFEDIKQLFKKADDLSKKYIANNENKNIMILFDELGFAEYAQST